MRQSRHITTSAAASPMPRLVIFTEGDMPQIKVSLSIGLANATQKDIIDIDETEWSECETDEQREDLINEYWRDWSVNYIDGDAELVE